MTDIVERLRYPITTGNPDSTTWIHEEYATCRDTMKEAADEIEALRAANANIRDEMKSIIADNERLRADVELLRKGLEYEKRVTSSLKG